MNDDRGSVISAAVDKAISELRAAVTQIESALGSCTDDVIAGDMTLRGLLMTFIGSFAGRAPTRDSAGHAVARDRFVAAAR